MAANVEKMTRAKGTKVSWHGEENTTDTAIASLEQWAVNASLDSRVTAQSLYIKGEGEAFEAVNDKIALVRDNDRRVLGYASPGYEIVQPIDLLEFIDHYVKVDDRFKWETAGSLDGGRKIFATARFQDDFKVLGEDHIPFLLASTSFDGSLATNIGSTMTRVVCQNTLRMALSSKETATLKYRHRTEWNAKHVEAVRGQLEQITLGFGHYKALAEAFAAERMSRDQAEKFLAGLIFKSKLEDVETSDGSTVQAWSKPSTRSNNLIEKMIRSYEQTIDEGTEAGTAWAIANAITRYADHDMGARLTKEREAEGMTKETVKQESAMFGAADRFKQTGIKSLMDYCGVDAKALVAA